MAKCMTTGDLALHPEIEAIVVDLNNQTPILDLFTVGDPIPSYTEEPKQIIWKLPSLSGALVASISNSDTTADFGALNEYIKNGDIIAIEDEQIMVSGVTTNSAGAVVSVQFSRGFAGTAAAAHAGAVSVQIISGVAGENCETDVCTKITHSEMQNIVQEIEECVCLSQRASESSSEIYGYNGPERVQLLAHTKFMENKLNTSVLYSRYFKDPSGAGKHSTGGIKWFIDNYGGYVKSLTTVMTKVILDDFLAELYNNRQSGANILLLNPETYRKLVALLPGQAASACCDANGNANITSGGRIVEYQPDSYDSPIFFVLSKDVKKTEIYALQSFDLVMRPWQKNDGTTKFFELSDWKDCRKGVERFLTTRFAVQISEPAKIGYLTNVTF